MAGFAGAAQIMQGAERCDKFALLRGCCTIMKPWLSLPDTAWDLIHLEVVFYHFQVLGQGNIFTNYRRSLSICVSMLNKTCWFSTNTSARDRNRSGFRCPGGLFHFLIDGWSLTSEWLSCIWILWEHCQSAANGPVPGDPIL